jgi:hypothetical protein
MTDLSSLYYYLDLQVLQTKEGISLSYSKYACDILHRFHMEDCKSTPSSFQYEVKLVATYTTPEVDATLYCQLVCSFLYMTHACLYISFSIGVLAWYMKTPHESCWKEVKGYFSISGYNSVWDTLQFRRGVLCWLVSLNVISLATRMIESLLQVMISALVLDLSLGIVRSNNLLCFL